MKSIAYKCLDSYSEEEIKKWFDEYYKVFKLYKIKKVKNIVNFDETGTRISYTGRELIVISTEIMEMYKVSPENRKSVIVCKTIRTDGSNPLPPFIIVPGIKIIEAWII